MSAMNKDGRMEERRDSYQKWCLERDRDEERQWRGNELLVKTISLLLDTQ